MENDVKLDFSSLEQNITDVLKEQQIKLGYREEMIRLFYPMASLNNLLGADLSLSGLKNALDQFCNYAKERFGKVEYSCSDKRFCIVIPEKGVAYVHEEVKDSPFLIQFIEKISEHHCSIDDILQVFYRYSNKVKCEKVTNGEFDNLIYFEDGTPDSYRYCIKFEDCHTIYHRFTISDYEDFEF